MDCTNRVLIIDNVEWVRSSTAEVLKNDAYTVFVAQGEGEQLLDTAWDMLEQTRCHLAIVDLRLLDDDDEDDWSGFELAANIVKDYPWVACMMLTSYGTFELARRAQIKHVELALMGKDEGPAALLERVQQVFDERVPCQWNQEWQGLDKPTQTDLHARCAHFPREHVLDLAMAESEMRELLGRLFPNAEKLQLRLLNPPHPPQTLSQANSLLLGVVPFRQGIARREVVVKIASHKAIRTESENYNEFVTDQVVDNRHTDLRRCAYTWHLAGIVYSLIGTELNNTTTFKQFYSSKEHSVDDIAIVLENLFGSVMRRWYEQAEKKEMDLVETYSAALHLTEARLQTLSWGNADTLPLKPLARRVPNPRVWLQRCAHNSVMRAQQNVIHGDLHSRNILVGPHRGVWLIDFERTGYNHALRDFIELETDIKFSLLQLKPKEMDLFVELELALLAQDKKLLAQKNIVTPPALRAHPHFDRAYQTITRVRRHAREKICCQDLRDYFWGLVIETIFVATLSSLSNSARKCVSISAGLACARLGDGKTLTASKSLTRFRVSQKTTKSAPTRVSANQKSSAHPLALARALHSQAKAVKGLEKTTARTKSKSRSK